MLDIINKSLDFLVLLNIHTGRGGSPSHKAPFGLSGPAELHLSSKPPLHFLLASNNQDTRAVHMF